MGTRKKHKVWHEVLGKMATVKTNYVVSSLNISRQYLYQILNGIRPMPDKILERLNFLLGTDFKKEKETTD